MVCHSKIDVTESDISGVFTVWIW